MREKTWLGLALCGTALADRRRFGLDAKRWAAFMAALDAPPRSLPQLQQLLTEPRHLRTQVSVLRIKKLARHHVLDGFDCGEDALNRSLLRFAFANQQANASQTYLVLAADEVAGFYTLVVGEVARETAPERVGKGLARHPIPTMLLARMGVNTRFQGRGLDKGLLKEGIVRTLAAADIAGIRAFAVHAKNDSARAFYERFDFISSPTDPLHLFVLIKDLRASLATVVHGCRRRCRTPEVFHARWPMRA